jgi:ABC-2 type transport system ATP-binding protein
MIEINNVSKTYEKKRSLANVTLTVESGEVIGLLGPNGAGKSTLLSILSTITAPTSGNVMIGGLSLKKNQKAIREVIGYVPQDIALWEELSVKENMKMWSKMISCTARRKMEGKSEKFIRRHEAKVKYSRIAYS